MSKASMAMVALLSLVACGTADDVVQREAAVRSSTSGLPATTDASRLSDEGPSQSTSPTDSASSSTPATVNTAPPRTARLSFTGDTLAHSPLWRQAQRNTGGTGFDFFPMFADVAEILSAADLAVCHLETPIAPEGEEFSTDPLYGVPPEIVVAMAGAGYDRCSTASNHILDRYARGVDRTIEVLEANGIAQSGAARSEIESLPLIFEVNGIRMAHLSYTYATNGIPLPEGEPWRTNLIDPVGIIRDAKVARDLGAEFVMVSLHWGTEKISEPDEQQIAVASEVTESEMVDLIVGHHAHVVQPIAQVNDVWVAYGLGNILSNLPVNDAWPSASQDAVILEVVVSVTADGVVEVERPVVRPTWVDKNAGWIIRDVDAALASGAFDPGRLSALEQSRARTESILGDFFAVQ